MSNETERELVHTRQITCRAFRLNNGWLEIEATLTDEKGQLVAFRSRPPVQPGAHMHSSIAIAAIEPGVLQATFEAGMRELPRAWHEG